MGACGSVSCQPRERKLSLVSEDRTYPLEPLALPLRRKSYQQNQAQGEPLVSQRKRKLRFRRKTSTERLPNGAHDQECPASHRVQLHRPADMDFSAAPWIRALMAPENAPHMILGVIPTSSREDIRRAYRQWSLRANMGPPPAGIEGQISPSNARLAIQRVTGAYSRLLVTLEQHPLMASVSGHPPPSMESFNERSSDCVEGSEPYDSLFASSTEDSKNAYSAAGSSLQTCTKTEESCDVEVNSNCSVLGQQGSPIWLPNSGEKKRQFLA